MSFWTSFAKQVILKILSEREQPRRSGSAEQRRCPQCGRMVPVESFRDGRCLLCRLEQEEKQERGDHHRSNHESHRSRPSGNDTNGLAEAYRILDCRESDSDAEIKRKFRLMIKECHVDSLPKDLPEYLVKAANERFIEVQTAYDRIREARKMA